MYCLCTLALIILMRASASLYPYIYGAHSKMIRVYVPWQRLQVKQSGISVRDSSCLPKQHFRDSQGFDVPYLISLKTDPAMQFGTQETTRAL